MSASTETDSEFDNRYEAYFNRPDIDGWEIRKGFGDLAGLDLVPEPAIVAAALRACRRVNDYALTTRILEVTAFKAMHNKDIWPYMVQVSTFILSQWPDYLILVSLHYFDAPRAPMGV